MTSKSKYQKQLAIAELEANAQKFGHTLTPDQADAILEAFTDSVTKFLVNGSSDIKPAGLMRGKDEKFSRNEN